MIATLLIAAELTFATGTYAPPLSHPVTQDFVKFLGSVQNVLKPVLFHRGTTETCRAFYRNLYDGPDLDVRIAFGYMDAPADEGPITVEGNEYPVNYALDGHARAAFTNWIQRSCGKSEQLCGFQEQPDDPDLYVKVQEPHARHPGTVRLRITHASAAPEYARNVEGGDQHALQSQLTQRSESNFLGGLVQADAVFYVGHARGGGGPDFAPPILRPDRHVNYDGYYRRVKPGMKKVGYFLQNTETPAKVISLLSCKATGLFVDQFRLETMAPGSMFVSAPNLTGFKAILLTTTAVFDSLLNGRCLTEIRSMLDRVEMFAEVGGNPLPLSELIVFDGVLPAN